MMRYRQDQQVIELTEFVVGNREHPNPDLYGSGWGSPYEHKHLSPVRAAMEAAAKDADQIVEIGCGGGRWTEVLARSMPAECRLLVVDATSAAFDLTGRWLATRGLNPPEGRLVCLDGELGEFGAGSDLVVSFDVFVHFEPALIEAYLRSIASILKPGGKLLLNLACVFDGWDGWERSDAWFEYVTERRDGLLVFCPDVAAVISELYSGPELSGWDAVQLHPSGYGSAFMELVRR